VEVKKCQWSQNALNSVKGLLKSDPKVRKSVELIKKHICDKKKKLVYCCGPEQQPPSDVLFPDCEHLCSKYPSECDIEDWNPFAENLLGTDPEKAFAMGLSIRNNNIKRFKKLYKETNMTNPFIRKFGTNPVTVEYYAAYLGRLEIFKIITDNLKDMQRKVPSGIHKGATTLHFAAQEGHLPIVEYITNCLQNINPAADDGKTPMHWAAEGGQNEVVNFFIERLSDKNPALNRSSEPLATLIRNIDFEEGIPISVTAFNKMTPLHSAAQRGHLEIVKAITSVSVNKNPKDAHGYTPLHAASSFGHLDTVEYLLKFEKDINIQTDDFWKKRSPLHWAVLNGHLNVVELLISQGANPDLRTSDNKTAFDISGDIKNGAIYRILLKGSDDQNRFSG